MTIIVGITHDNSVYLGGDRSASDGELILSTLNPKVFKTNDWVYGYAGTIGIGQLMSFLNFPPPSEVNIYNHLRLTVVEELKKAMDTFTNPPTEHDTVWLIGANGRLFELHSMDWSVIEIKESAIGGGSQYALGSLYTSIEQDPISRIGLALGAAIMYSPACQGPIDIVNTLFSD